MTTRPSRAVADGLGLLTALAVLIVGLAVAPSVAQAEDLDATHCFAGTFNAFQGSDTLKPVLSYSHSGIIRGANKQLDSAGTYCTGVQRGVGPTRQGHVLCKVVDADGDIIIIGDPYTGLKSELRILEGTGKWKGITGSVVSEQIASAAKSAVPGSYHTCTAWKGKYEISK